MSLTRMRREISRWDERKYVKLVDRAWFKKARREAIAIDREGKFEILVPLRILTKPDVYTRCN